MAALSASPPSNHPFHPFRTTRYNRPTQPDRTIYISTSSPPSPRTRQFTSIPPEIPAPPKILRKTPSTSALHSQPMPSLPLKNRQRAPTLPSPDQRGRNAYAERRADESCLPFEPPSTNWIDRRTRKRSQGGFFSPPLSPISTAHISAPSSTIRLSSDPTKASAQLGFNHGYPITPPDLPSIHGVFDRFDAGPTSPVKSQTNRKLSTKKPPPIDTVHTSRKSRRDTLKLPMMEPTDRSASTHPPSSSGATTTDELDMSEWDLVSIQSVRRSSPSSRKPDPSPVPTFTNFNEWVDPETQLSPQAYAPNELDLRAIEVLEHFSGHLLKDGWGDELERYRPNPKSAPAVPAKSKLRNDQSRTLPGPGGDTMGYAEWRHRSKREDLDAGSMRSWREARKRSKPPTLRPLSEQPPVGSNHLQGVPPNPVPRRPSSPIPHRDSSLAPGLSVTRPSVDGRESHDEETPKGTGMRRVSSALSRMSSEEKRRPKIKVPLMLDSKVKGEARGVSSPTSPVPIQHRPLPPLPGRTAGPSRSNSSGPTGLLQLKFQRGLLRPKRPATAPIAEDEQSGQLRKLSARDEPHPGSPLSPRPDATDKRDKRKGMTALSFLAMDEPYATERVGQGARPSLDGAGPVVVEHILPPEELSKIVSETSARRGSWSSSSSGSTAGAGPVGETGMEPTDAQSPITSPSVRKSMSMERKSKKKTEYRKSSGQASLSMSLTLDHSSFSPLSPISPFEDDVPARPTALPPPPRPRYSLTGRKDGRGAGFMSTPPMPETSPPISTTLAERPQTFMGLSSGTTSPLSRYSPLPTRPTSPIIPSPSVSPVSPVLHLYSPCGSISLSPTPEPPEPSQSPVTSIFGLKRYSGTDFGPAPTPTPGSVPGKSLVQSTQSRPSRESMIAPMAVVDDRASVSTSNTSRRDAEREERERAMREWLRMKPRRGTKEGGANPAP